MLALILVIVAFAIVGRFMGPPDSESDELLWRQNRESSDDDG